MDGKEKAKLAVAYRYNEMIARVKLMERFPSMDRKSRKIKQELKHKVKKLKNFV